jgi:hypothetical protein
MDEQKRSVVIEVDELSFSALLHCAMILDTLGEDSNIPLPEHLKFTRVHILSIVAELAQHFNGNPGAPIPKPTW